MLRKAGSHRQGWARANRLGRTAACAHLLGIVAVLFNVIGWTLFDPPAQAADTVATLAAVAVDGADICSHSPADHHGPSDHAGCAQCFPLSGHCCGALLPAAAALTRIAPPVERIAGAWQSPTPPTQRFFRRHARAPPVLA